jgi:hypothetical protein
VVKGIEHKELQWTRSAWLLGVLYGLLFSGLLGIVGLCYIGDLLSLLTTILLWSFTAGVAFSAVTQIFVKLVEFDLRNLSTAL